MRIQLFRTTKEAMISSDGGPVIWRQPDRVKPCSFPMSYRRSLVQCSDSSYTTGSRLFESVSVKASVLTPRTEFRPSSELHIQFHSRVRGTSLLVTGELGTAERAFAHYDPDHDTQFAWQYGTDQVDSLRFYWAMSLILNIGSPP